MPHQGYHTNHFSTRSILHNGCICSLGYFPFQPVVRNWSSKGCGMSCPVCGKGPLLLMGKSSLCGESRFPLKKYVTMTICLTSNSRYENQCALEASLNKTSFPFCYSFPLPKFHDEITISASACLCDPLPERSVQTTTIINNVNGSSWL